VTGHVNRDENQKVHNSDKSEKFSCVTLEYKVESTISSADYFEVFIFDILENRKPVG